MTTALARRTAERRDTPQAAAAKFEREEQRRGKIERCKHDLWYLLTVILKRKWNPNAVTSGKFRGRGLTYRLHKPICAWYDMHQDDPLMFLSMRRGGHKTELVIGQIIQDFIRDPKLRLIYFQNVDEMADEVCAAVIYILLHNKDLRALEPIGQIRDDKGNLVEEYNIIPRKGKWYTSSNFVLNAPGSKSRGKSFRAFGITSGITGGHCDKVYLDDIIAERTVLNSELGKVKSTFESTIMPVCDTKMVRASGTPWSPDGLYADWEASPDWYCCIIPGSIVGGDETLKAIDWSQKKIRLQEDESLENPTYGDNNYTATAIAQLKLERRTMGKNFSPQIMLVSTPSSEKPWLPENCEHFTGIQKAGDMPGIGGKGRFFLLSDPAPYLAGSYKGLTEKQRGDGTKDEWAIALVRLRNRGEVQDIILIDGAASHEWEHQEGADKCAAMMKWCRVKFGETPIWISEQPDEHFTYMQKATRKIGLHLIEDVKGGPIKFAEYNKKDGKNARILRLAEKAANHEVWICTETCAQEYLHGDGVHTGALTQLRKFVRMKPGYNMLRFDDRADVLSRAMDERLLEFAPLPSLIADLGFLGFTENDQQDDSYSPSRSLYCGV